MTTYHEQIFLYGEVEPDVPIPEPLMTLITYADLTAGSAFVFATVILLTLIIGYWDSISFFISTTTKKMVISPMQSVFSLLNCCALELFRLSSSPDDRHDALATLRERLTRWIVNSGPYRLASTIVDWYFPWNRPIAASCRLFSSWVCGLKLYSSLLVPAARYISGVVDGWNSEIHWFHCPGAISSYHLDDQLSRRGLSEAYYCFGEKAGLRLHDLSVNDWQLLSRLLSDDGEIDHYHAIVIVASVVSLVVLATGAYTVLPESAAFQRLKSFLRRQNPYPNGRRPLTQTEIDLWDMINGYEGDLAKKKAQLAKKAKLLTVTTTELCASKQRQEEGWALVEKLTAARNEAVEAHCRELSNNRRLRQRLVNIGGQLQVAEGSLQGERQELAKARQQVVDERKQLVEEHQQLASQRQNSSEHQRLADDRDRLAKERRRLEDERDQLAAERLQLAEEHQRLVDEHQRDAGQQQELVNRQHHLASNNQQLAIRCSELSASLETVRQERDAAMLQLDVAKEQVMSQQQEIDVTNLNADITRVEAEISFSQAQENEARLHKFMSDLKSACNLAVAQERSATDEARQIASALEMEVNDFRGKIGLAMRDAQRSHEQAVASQRTIDILEHRLAKYQQFETGGTQEIPKRQIGNLGSISTALSEKEVIMANQQAQINDLTRQLEQAKNAGHRPAPADESVQGNFNKLRAVLDKERRERTEDNVRWSSMTRGLEAANQKLRISLSNAESKYPRRQGARRPPTVP